MSNAFIMGRRYTPTGGGGNMPSGSQSFTANGTFTAPYTGVYTVAITAPISKGGDGADGLDGYVDGDDSTLHFPTGGGAGGSAYISVYPLIISVWLTQGQQVPVTVNTSVASFGSYGSFAAGTAGGNGTSGIQKYNSILHGTGGAGGSMPMTSTSGTLTAIMPPIPSASLSGGGGSGNSGSVSGDPSAFYDGATGGRPSTAFGNAGGCGGEGSALLEAYFAAYTPNIDIIYTNVFRRAGQPAKAGRIDIIWGNQ